MGSLCTIMFLSGRLLATCTYCTELLVKFSNFKDYTRTRTYIIQYPALQGSRRFSPDMREPKMQCT